jgi:2-polyprenyl-3-methyl-5-hydroxy-6-metoxy-1,4-benzoquinol methylase
MKRIGILVVAYNAAGTLAQVLDRIPPDFRPRISEVLVGDDHSQDSTYLIGLGYQQTTTDLELTVVRHPQNLGYGGNQKAGYRWAIDAGLDIVVLLHGDGQYAPELLPEIVRPLEEGDADAVFGSRMLEPGRARQGGMPLYKYLGNKVLTRVENAVAGMSLSEWHSGYRAYSVSALRDLPFERNSNGFDFDTEIILQLKESGKRIVEVAIPTYYGDEICYVNGLRYARDILRDVARYRAHKMGFGSGELAFATTAYEFKEGDDGNSSHQRILTWMRNRPRGRVLDLGCSDGQLSGRVKELGHEVTGVDIEKFDGVGGRVDRFVEADLDVGIPDDAGGDYDLVLAADVLEHLRSPEKLLRQAAAHMRPGGSIIASVPNFAHWYPRTRVALGLFDYDRRGILDAGHVRFFTRSSFERLVRRAGLSVRRCEAVGPPPEIVKRGARAGEHGREHGAGLLARLNRLSCQLWPNLFAYQFLFELEHAPRQPTG